MGLFRNDANLKASQMLKVMESGTEPVSKYPAYAKKFASLRNWMAADDLLMKNSFTQG